MKKFKYRVEVLRTNGNIRLSAKEMETAINKLSDDGWKVINMIYHSSSLCYELLFEKQLCGEDLNG